MPEGDELAAVPPHLVQVTAAPGFAEARDIVLGRCAMCHAAAPNWPGLHWPPKGVALETDAQIARHAREIALQAGYSHAMPPGNLTYMEPAERAVLVRWYAGLGRAQGSAGLP